jgi:hypothetical protein
MTLYARSDVMSVSIPVQSGGCGKTHSRPVQKGAPSREFKLDCPGCENFLKGGGRTYLKRKPGDKDADIPASQERVADIDPCWGATPESVPETPDEATYVAKRNKVGADQLAMLNALANAKAAGFDIPTEALDMLNRKLPGVLAGNDRSIAVESSYGLDDLSTDKLKSMCKQQGLPSTGTRTQLIERLS